MSEPCHVRALKTAEVEVSSGGLPLFPLLVGWTVSARAPLAGRISSTFQQLLLVDDDRVSLAVHVAEINIESLLLITRGEVAILARQSRIVKTALKQLSALFLRRERLAKAGCCLHGHLRQQVVFAHDWVH